MLTAIMAADQGTDAMAAHQVGMNIMALSFAFGDGLQATAVALIGRSLGSGDPDLAKEYGRTCRLIGAVIAVCLVAIYYLVPAVSTICFSRKTTLWQLESRLCMS